MVLPLIPVVIIGARIISIGARVVVTGMRVKKVADAKKTADLARKAMEAKKRADQARRAAEVKRKAEQAKKTGTKVKRQRKQKKDDKCDKKKKKGSPVDSVTGCKVLDGSIDLDFSLNSAYPFVWKRTYSSQSDIGTSKNPYTWLGQGWDCPFVAQIKVSSFKKKIEIIYQWVILWKFLT